MDEPTPAVVRQYATCKTCSRHIYQEDQDSEGNCDVCRKTETHDVSGVAPVKPTVVTSRIAQAQARDEDKH